MDKFTFTTMLDDENDNSNVTQCACIVLASEGKTGWDAFRSALADARIADMRVSRGVDTLGRESLEDALVQQKVVAEWSKDIRRLLVKGIMKRAMGLKML